MSGAKVLGRHAGTLTMGLVASDVMEGIKSNCLYDEGRTSWEVPPSEGATILVLSLESRNDEIQIIDAEAVTPGRADEYQLRCFESWLANRVIPAEGIPSGQRYRVRFPVAF